jgi:hypothetical protein
MPTPSDIDDEDLGKTTPFLPIFEPYNDAARVVLDWLCDKLPDLPTTPKMRSKYRSVVASFLAAMQSAAKSDKQISFSFGNDAYTAYPSSAGRQVIQNTAKMLQAAGFLEMVSLGRRVFKNTDGTKTKDREDVPTVFDFDQKLLTVDGFTEAVWLEVGRPLVAVSAKLDPWERYWVEQDNRRTPKLRRSQAERRYKGTFTACEEHSRKLQKLWLVEPMCIPVPKRSGSFERYAACATRVFHNGSMSSGGRYYGLWTTLKKKQVRSRATIGGEPVVHLDLAASQPTLLSGLLGMTMNLQGGTTWTDVYVEIVQALGAEDDDTPELKRKKAKQVVMEAIGSGSHTRKRPAKGSELSFSDDEYQGYLSAAKRVVPALELLSFGSVDGSNFLSFHESNMITDAMLDLAAHGIVAYPMHDALIVKQSNQEAALKSLRESVTTYVARHTKRGTFIPAVTIEGLGMGKVQHSGYHSL